MLPSVGRGAAVSVAADVPVVLLVPVLPLVMAPGVVASVGRCVVKFMLPGIVLPGVMLVLGVWFWFCVLVPGALGFVVWAKAAPVALAMASEQAAAINSRDVFMRCFLESWELIKDRQGRRIDILWMQQGSENRTVPQTVVGNVLRAAIWRCLFGPVHQAASSSPWRRWSVFAGSSISESLR